MASREAGYMSVTSIGPNWQTFCAQTASGVIHPCNAFEAESDGAESDETPLSSTANALKTCCERNPRDDPDGIPKLMLPDADDAPTRLAQLTIHKPVAGDIPGHLLTPHMARNNSHLRR